MNGARRVALSALVLLVVCGAAVGHRIHWSSKLGHAVHPVAGAYSEANAYRAAMNYLRDGLFARAGLPKIHGPELREHGAMASLPPGAKRFRTPGLDQSIRPIHSRSSSLGTKRLWMPNS